MNLLLEAFHDATVMYSVCCVIGDVPLSARDELYYVHRNGVHRKARFFELARHSFTLSFPDAPDVLTPPPRTHVRCVEQPGSRY